MRPDGTRVRNLTPIVQALPYIMPKRYDAQNWASDYVDEEVMKAYIRQKRRGVKTPRRFCAKSAFYNFFRKDTVNQAANMV